MRQVIFIAGTAYSGSSMLDMILGSSDSSFSMGEVRALFYPTKKNHLKPPCGCGSDSCRIWEVVKTSGEHNLYSTIYERFPETRTIIDSSKEPFWIAKQQKRLKEIGIKTKVILVWKSPQEFALSRLKRGYLHGWDYAWVHYHRLFFSLIKNNDLRSVSYKELAVSPEITIEKLCKTVGVKYNSFMLNFWEKKHHMLFGNTLAKYHMYEKSNENFKKSLKNLNEREILFDNEKIELEQRHRSIYYVTDFIDQLPKTVHSDLEKNQFVNELIDLLKSKNINIDLNDAMTNSDNKRLIYSKMRLEILRIKRFLKYRSFLLQQRFSC